MKNNKSLCPVCGKHYFTGQDTFDICPHCGWQHNYVDEKDTDIIGPNDLRLRDFKLRYEYFLKMNPSYYYNRDGKPSVEQIEDMDCPVCRQFRFTKLNWFEILDGRKPADVFCIHCGWHYDLEQSESPDLPNKANTMSLNEYRSWYNGKIAENPDYDYLSDNYTAEAHMCPVCGKYKFKDRQSFDICSFCGWQDDGTDEDDSEIIGPNDLMFSKYKRRYEYYLREYPGYKWEKDGLP